MPPHSRPRLPFNLVYFLESHHLSHKHSPFICTPTIPPNSLSLSYLYEHSNLIQTQPLGQFIRSSPPSHHRIASKKDAFPSRLVQTQLRIIDVVRA